MADGINQVFLAGFLGADPELRFTQGGEAVLNMRLATTESYKDKSGERKERTDWHSLTVWGKRAEALSKILGKGSAVTVTGSLRTSSYEKDGEKRYKTEVNVHQLVLGGRGGGGERDDRSESSANGRYGRSGAGANAKHTAPADDYSDDIPF